MSKKLIAKIQGGRVVVRNKTASEVNVWFRGRDGKRLYIVLGTFAEEELAPHYTDAARLENSNIEELVKRRVLAIV